MGGDKRDGYESLKEQSASDADGGGGGGKNQSADPQGKENGGTQSSEGSDIDKLVIKPSQHVDNFDGFWGKVSWVLSPNIGGGRYDWNGDLAGAAPIGGAAPVPNFGKVKNAKDIWALAKNLRRSTFKKQGPQSVNRVDIPGKGSNGETIHNQLPHVHLKDGRAFNLDGTWKHGEGSISNQIIKWLNDFL